MSLMKILTILNLKNVYYINNIYMAVIDFKYIVNNTLLIIINILVK